MRHDEIIAKVRTIINEHGIAEDLNISEDRVLLDDYIIRAIPDAVVVLAQKGYRVNVCSKVPDLESSEIKIPEDFLSLLMLKLKEWNKVVTRVVDMGSPEYSIAMNKYTKPGVNSPMCYRRGDFIVCLPEGVFENWEYNKMYDQTEGLHADPKEMIAVCYMAAAVVCAFFENDQCRQRLNDIAMNMLQ